MAIGNDQELTKVVAQASKLVQRTQDHCGCVGRDCSKISAPLCPEVLIGFGISCFM